MNCPRCCDKGVLRVSYHDGAPTDYAVCLCEAGQNLRNDRNARRHTGYPLWMAWAANAGVDLDHVVMVEDVLDQDEIATIPRPDVSSNSSISAAMQTRRVRL